MNCHCLSLHCARRGGSARRGPVQVVQDDAGPLPSQPSHSLRHYQQHGQRGLRVLFAVAGQALHHGTPAGECCHVGLQLIGFYIFKQYFRMQNCQWPLSNLEDLFDYVHD